MCLSCIFGESTATAKGSKGAQSGISLSHSLDQSPAEYSPLSTHESDPASPGGGLLGGNNSSDSFTDDESGGDRAKGCYSPGLDESLECEESEESAMLASKIGGSPSRDRRAIRRRVFFLGEVTVKVIDLPGLSRSPLKQVTTDDVPLARYSTGDDHAVEVGAEDVASREMQSSQEESRCLYLYSNGAELVDRPSLLSADECYSWETLRSRCKNAAVSLRNAVRRREVRLGVLLYGLGALASTLCAEIFPLWVVTTPEDGGLGYSAGHIGVSTMICGVLTLAVQLLLYPRLAEHLGVARMFRLGAILFALSSFLQPGPAALVRQLHQYSLSGSSRAAITWSVRASTLLFQLGGMTSSNWMLVSVFVIINNSCYSRQRATVNALG